MSFVNTKAACKQLGVGAATLRRWDKDGKIKTMRTPGGVRLYDLDSLESERRVLSMQGFSSFSSFPCAAWECSPDAPASSVQT